MTATARRLARHCAVFREPDTRRALFELAATAVPFAALSDTLFADALLSLTAPTDASDVSSLRLTVKVSLDVEPSELVASTVTVCEVALS